MLCLEYEFHVFSVHYYYHYYNFYYMCEWNAEILIVSLLFFSLTSVMFCKADWIVIAAFFQHLLHLSVAMRAGVRVYVYWRASVYSFYVNPTINVTMAKGYFIFATIFGLHTFNGKTLAIKLQISRKRIRRIVLEIVRDPTQSFQEKRVKKQCMDGDIDDGKWRPNH